MNSQCSMLSHHFKKKHHYPGLLINNFLKERNLSRIDYSNQQKCL